MPGLTPFQCYSSGTGEVLSCTCGPFKQNLWKLGRAQKYGSCAAAVNVLCLNLVLQLKEIKEVVHQHFVKLLHTIILCHLLLYGCKWYMELFMLGGWLLSLEFRLYSRNLCVLTRWKQ